MTSRRLYRKTPLLAVCAVLVAGCHRPAYDAHWPNFGGDAKRGAIVITQASCGGCHAIPGLQQANGMVGPPLDHFARRTMIAGLLPNTPERLIEWVRFPQTVLPGNAMPDSHLSDQQARDVAAYLYTLR
jgi:cytochrome c1